jgi:pantothenate kinase
MFFLLVNLFQFQASYSSVRSKNQTILALLKRGNQDARLIVARLKAAAVQKSCTVEQAKSMILRTSQQPEGLLTRR